MACGCCGQWSEVSVRVAGAAAALASRNASCERAMRKMRAALAARDDEIARLKEQNERDAATIAAQGDEIAQVKKANAELNAKANGIRIVTAKDKPKGKRKRGRPKGKPGNKTYRPKDIHCWDIVDCTRCPKCRKSDKLSGVTDMYDRVVTRTIIKKVNVLYFVLRRYCNRCDKQVSQQPEGVMHHARNDITHDRIMTRLNLHGLSHGKCSKMSMSVLGVDTSTSATYRTKIRVSGACRPEYERIRRGIQNERYVHGDETWWPVVEEKGDAKGDAKTKKKNAGYVILVLGENHCLARVTKSRGIAELKKTLPGYQGTVISDSYPGWLHIGIDHQMCTVHQIRLIKKDIKYNKKLDGEARAFLEALLKIFKKIVEAGKMADREDRIAAADGIDAEIAELFGRDYADKSKTASRYAKRYRREAGFYTTHLRDDPPVEDEPVEDESVEDESKYMPGNNNPVERVGRKLVAIRSDGGGNRSQKGMDANSILFTVMLTDQINGRSFYEHLARLCGGDG